MQRAIDESHRKLDVATAELEKANARLLAMETQQQQQLEALTEAVQRERQPADCVEPKESPPPHLLEGAEAAITCIAPLDCSVDGAWIQRALGMEGPLQARIVPARRDGKIAGVKLYGLRRGSVGKLLGLKNGDMIQTVSGRAVHSLADLLVEIRRAKGTIKVELVRKGRVVEATVRIP